MKIFLDDVRDVPDESWTLARSASDAIRFLLTTDVTHISLDHDLGDSEISGYHVAKFIEERTAGYANYFPPVITIHSANPVGRDNIQNCVYSIRRILDRKVCSFTRQYPDEP